MSHIEVLLPFQNARGIRDAVAEQATVVYVGFLGDPGRKEIHESAAIKA